MKFHFLSIPKVQMILTLVSIFVSAFIFQYHFSLSLLFYYLCVVGVTFFTDFIFLKLRHEPLFPLWAAIVTGTIIALLNAPNLFLVGSVAGILAMFSKHFIKFRGKHIFNPAAFGLFFSNILFHTSVSWWGVTFQQPVLHFLPVLLFMILLLPGVVSAIFLHRHRIVFAFLGINLFLSALLHFHEPTFSINTLLFGNLTIFFFSLVMLPEPMTSPNQSRPQLLYGATVATLFVCLSIFLSLPTLSVISSIIPDFLLLSLLIGNIAFSELWKKNPSW